MPYNIHMIIVNDVCNNNESTLLNNIKNRTQNAQKLCGNDVFFSRDLVKQLPRLNLRNWQTWMPDWNMQRMSLYWLLHRIYCKLSVGFTWISSRCKLTYLWRSSGCDERKPQIFALVHSICIWAYNYNCKYATQCINMWQNNISTTMQYTLTCGKRVTSKEKKRNKSLL